LISLAQCALIAVSHRDELSILHADHHGRLWLRLARSATPGVAFGIGYALSVAGLHGPSSLCWLLVPVLMLAARLGFHQRPGPAPSEATGELA
jgi:hypothetical protein